jgi:hypothetical protein
MIGPTPKCVTCMNRPEKNWNCLKYGLDIPNKIMMGGSCEFYKPKETLNASISKK